MLDRLRQFVHRFLSLFQAPQLDCELSAELATHLQFAVEENLQRGLSPDEARREALVRLGGQVQTQEQHRDARGIPVLSTLLQDLRFAGRMLAKNPGFTAIAVLTLALGIGANTAIFSLVNSILLVSLPYPHPEQLVSVTSGPTNAAYPKGGVVAMREQVHSVDVAGYSEGHDFNLTGRGEPVRLSGTLVSAEFFNVLGTRPELGRTFNPGEDVPGQDSFVILSHALWQQRFAADRNILGRVIELQGVGRQVVGVMPASFRFPSPRTQLWIPLHNDAGNVTLYWADDYMPVLGRLRPGSSIQQAQSEIRVFQSRVVKMFPWTMPPEWNADVGVVPLQTGLVADIRVRLLILLGAVILVVLIACANVANLTLARAATREKEIAVRSALGAGTRRIVRQLLTESVLLAGVGAVLGLFLATQGLTILKTLLPADTPRIAEAHIDWRVLIFTGGLAVLTGLISGLAPALQSSNVAPTDALRSGGRSGSLPVSQRLRSTFVVGEVASAVLLVIAAALLIRSFWALSHVNPGFRSHQLLTARITPNQSFCSDPQRCLSFYRTVLNQVRSSPGDTSAALINTLPLGGRVAKRSLDLENHIPSAGQTSPLFWLNVITPGYFQVMQIPLLSGREFTDSDIAGAPVAIIPASTARRYWPNESAVGKHIRLVDDTEWRTIVGVVADVRAQDLQHDIPGWMNGAAYVPYNSAATLEDRSMPQDMSLVVRTSSDPARLGGAIRDTVAGLNPDVPVSEIKTMDAVLSESVASPRATTLLFSVFAALAFILGVIGIYGVLSFLVSNRTREIGIRMAVGAQHRDVLWSVMQEGGKFSFLGIFLGVAGALALMRVLSSQLYGVSTTDPATFGTVAVVVAAVSLFACYIPARRAMRVDPIIALRYE